MQKKAKVVTGIVLGALAAGAALFVANKNPKVKAKLKDATEKVKENMKDVSGKITKNMKDATGTIKKKLATKS